jgi:hypothetical protein
MENNIEDQKEPVKWVDRKSWDEFRKTGLLQFVNALLHVFGWAICVKVDYDKDTETETSGVLECYPARVKFRGFSEEDQTDMYKKISDYQAANACDIRDEAHL